MFVIGLLISDVNTIKMYMLLQTSKRGFIELKVEGKAALKWFIYILSRIWFIVKHRWL